MNRIQLAFLVSGMIHLGIFTVGGNFLITSPAVEVTPGKTRIQVVFREPTPEPEKKISLLAPASIAEEMKLPEPEKEIEKIEIAPSVEMQGAQYKEVDYASNPPPLYPRIAVLRNIQGRVLLSVEVSERGAPTGIKIEQSSGHDILDQAAVEAVLRWKFSPAHLGRMAMRSQVKIPIQFKIIEKR